LEHESADLITELLQEGGNKYNWCPWSD
jgi:hypothetical protein